jgi:hypothetical protein
MIRTLHAAAGAIALLTLATFWLSTAISETLLSADAVATVKTAIVSGLFVLIPAMAAAGASGTMLAKSRPAGLTTAKSRRMRLLAINGLVIMIPAALFLARKANGGELDTAFFAVQGLELAVGAVQIVLLSRNFRDGLRLTGRISR